MVRRHQIELAIGLMARGLELAIREIKNGNEQAVKRGIDFATFVAGMQHDLSPKRLSIA